MVSSTHGASSHGRLQLARMHPICSSLDSMEMFLVSSPADGAILV